MLFQNQFQNSVSRSVFKNRFQEVFQKLVLQDPISESFPNVDLQKMTSKSGFRLLILRYGNRRNRYPGMIMRDSVGWKALLGFTFTSVRGDCSCCTRCPRDPIVSLTSFLSGLDSGLLCCGRACFWLVSPFLIPVYSPRNERGKPGSMNRRLEFEIRA